LAKVQRKVVKRRRQAGLPTEMILLILGGAVIVIAVLAFVLWPRPKVVVAGDPQGLAVCGSVPCPTKGDPNAPVKMVDVSSFACSHCRDYALTTEPQIEDKYIKTGKVYYIAHSLGFDAQAQGLTAAALCANDQGKYWEYSAALFKNQDQVDPNSLALYAQQVGLDTQAFAACVSSGKHTKDAKDSTDAALAAGVDATPSFFVNGKLVVRGALPLAEFQAQIDQALKTGK
jgi:protein-disulfide isomerase